MFDGMMPPTARALKSETVSGVELVPKVPGVAKPTDGAAVGILQLQSTVAKPRVLTIGFPTAGIFPTSVFPPYPAINAEGPARCGMLDITNAVFADGNKHLACVLEYGSGASAQKVWFDWAPGSYNLPPCEFVRVSALAWGTDWAANEYPALASVSPGDLQGAHPPTVSTVVSMAAGVTTTLVAPGCARSWDFDYAGDPTTPPVLTVQAGPTVIKNYSTGQFIPSSFPLPTYPGEPFSIVSDINALVLLTFYLAL